MQMLLLTLLLLSPTHSARADDKAIDAAFAVCNSIPFNDDKEHCQETVNHANFFQPSLVQLCSTQFPHDVKGKCLAAVADKTAHETALKGCQEKKFWDDLSSCLGKIMKPYVAPVVATPVTATATATTDRNCKKEKVTDLINTALARTKKLQYLDLYDSLVQLRAQLTLCGFD